MDLSTANLIEAAIWFAISCALGVKAFHAEKELRKVYVLLGSAFLAFGISDLVESRSGAWWRPLWLFALKAGCVAALLLGFARYYRRKGR
jgi:hypothetical protein